MTIELGRSLLLSGAISTERLSEALYSVITRGIPLARALVGFGVVEEATLEAELARSQPEVLRAVVPDMELMARLPAGLCERLAAVPLRLDPATGEVLVAVIDPRDTHPAAEIGYHLEARARGLRASYASLREAIESYPLVARSLAAPMGAPRDDEPPTVSRPASLSPPSVALPLVHRVQGASDPPGDAPSPSPVDPDIPVLSDRDVRFTTRSWDNVTLPTSAGEAYWDIDPVFELRRLGPPPTDREPEPPTMRLHSEGWEAGSIEPPPRSRAPIASNAPAPPYPDLSTTLSGIRAADDRDALLVLVQSGVRAVARRVALLVVKKEEIAGWSCTPEFGDEEALRGTRVALDPPSTLASVVPPRVELGPLLGILAAPLLRVMGRASRDVAVGAIRVGPRPAVIVVADELGDTLLATKRIEEIAKAAGEGLVRILRSKRA